MRKRYNITIGLVFAMLSGLYAQIDTKSVLQDVTRNYEDTPAYEIEATYTMYRGLTGNNSTETYKGLLVKNGDINSFRILDSEVIQSSMHKINLNHKSKTISYTKQEQTGLANSPIAINQFLDFFEQSKITEKDGELICELVSKKGNQQIPYGKIILYVDKATSLLKKQVFFFATAIPFQEGEKTTMDYGRLVIDFAHKGATVKTKALDIDTYVQIKKDGNIKIAENFKTYIVINQEN